jgi:hypothetical protein
VYLTDISLFPRMNAIYTQYFRKTDRREHRGSGEPGRQGRIEITVTARNEGGPWRGLAGWGRCARR